MRRHATQLMYTYATSPLGRSNSIIGLDSTVALKDVDSKYMVSPSGLPPLPPPASLTVCVPVRCSLKLSWVTLTAKQGRMQTRCPSGRRSWKAGFKSLSSNRFTFCCAVLCCAVLNLLQHVQQHSHAVWLTFFPFGACLHVLHAPTQIDHQGQRHTTIEHVLLSSGMTSVFEVVTFYGFIPQYCRPFLPRNPSFMYSAHTFLHW